MEMATNDGTAESPHHMLWMGSMVPYNPTVASMLMDPGAQTPDNEALFPGSLSPNYDVASDERLRLVSGPDSPSSSSADGQLAMTRTGFLWNRVSDPQILSPDFQRENIKKITIKDISKPGRYREGAQRVWCCSPPQEISTDMVVEDYNYYQEEPSQYMTSTATQTQAGQSGNRKIKAVKHPGLKLKTPITYQKDCDPRVIPIMKDGMAVCAHCGAIGVKHAFYTRERNFCSQRCARENAELQKYASQHMPENILGLVRSRQQGDASKVDPGDITMKELMGSEPMAPPEPTLPPIVFCLPLPVLEDDPPLTPPTGRKNVVRQPSDTHHWSTEEMAQRGFAAAPVDFFKHAPMACNWDDLTVGMKVEVENTDRDDDRDSFWVATVLRIQGYYALLRYEGFGQLNIKDFWVNLCASSVHPVGWCAMRGKPLIPPISIVNKYSDWKKFLTKRLNGARTLPTYFYQSIENSMKSRFSPGMRLEVVDKARICQMKLATVHRILGKRLNLKYWDDRDSGAGFWAHEDSPVIHPVGWAQRVGHEMCAPPEYLMRVEHGEVLPEDAPDDLFLHPPEVDLQPGDLQEGMKLEAVDPLNPSSICVATIVKVLLDGYFMVSMDPYEVQEGPNNEGPNGNFCYHISSPYIFPAGFCRTNSISLTAPHGYKDSEFDWDQFLAETHHRTVPVRLFIRDIPMHHLVEGMHLEAAEVMDPHKVCVATVKRIVTRLVRVHFDGWEEEFDQWMDLECPDIFPVGWCHLVGHKLEPPRPEPVATATGGNKGPRVWKKKPRRRQKKANKGSPTSVTNTAKKCPTVSPPSATSARSLIEANCGPVFGGDTLSVGSSCGGRDSVMSQESSGPDQPMPITPEPVVPPQPVAQPPIPRERPVSSYISSPATSGKLIPRLIDSSGLTGELGELIPADWNVFDVAQFLRVNDCAVYCDNFNRKKIDGKSLLNLTEDDIFELTGGKVGPSLKIHDLIQQLKARVNPSQSRFKGGIGKKMF
uniref:Polycomb protein Sfmbt-like n=1 Tax=Timema cristinae TaxID=61476 RepID=A0A7R9CUD7_TIMCR|nr:unnamed protein product [Timema cristinae]